MSRCPKISRTFLWKTCLC